MIRSAAWFLAEIKTDARSLSTVLIKLGSHSPRLHYAHIDSLIILSLPIFLYSLLTSFVSPRPSRRSLLHLPSNFSPPSPPLPFLRVFPASASISSSSRRRHDSEEGDSHRRHKHKKSKRSKEGKEAGEDIGGDQENQDAME